MQENEISRWLIELPAKQDSQSSPFSSNFVMVCPERATFQSGPPRRGRQVRFGLAQILGFNMLLYETTGQEILGQNIGPSLAQFCRGGPACNHLIKWRILSQPGRIGSGKNKKSLNCLLGLKITLRTCFESNNFSSNSCPQGKNLEEKDGQTRVRRSVSA